MNLTKIFSFFLLIFGLQVSTLYAQKNLGFYFGPTAVRVLGGGYLAKHKIKPGGVLGAFFEQEVDSTTYLRYGFQYHYQTAHLETESSSPSSGSYSNTDYQFQQLRLSIGYGIKITPRKKVDTRILFGACVSYNLRVHIKGNSWKYSPATAIDTAGNEVHYSVTTSEEFDRFDNGAMSPFYFGAYIGWSTTFPLNERISLLLQNEYYLNIGSKGGGFLTGILGCGITYKLK